MFPEERIRCRKDAPKAFPIFNDGAHRVELCWGDITKNQKEVKDIDRDLRLLHNCVGSGYGREFVLEDSASARKTSSPNETSWSRHFMLELDKVLSDYSPNIRSLNRQLGRKRQSKTYKYKRKRLLERMESRTWVAWVLGVSSIRDELALFEEGQQDILGRIA